MDLEKYKLKRLIKTLEKARGLGTSVVTVMIPANYQINLIRQLLTDEYSTATNIKSRVNRLSVLSAITSAQTRLKQYKQTPPNGLALFCGEVVADDGKSKKLVLDIEPPKPLTRKLYLCDNKFHLEALTEMLNDDETFGFIIIDGNGTLFATLSGNNKTIVSQFTVTLPKKHGRGGQSALRFARLRLEARHNYIRKVAETATHCFISKNICNVKGIIIAGSAELKKQLYDSQLFDKRLHERVLKLIDTSYGGENGFNQAIELASDIMGSMKMIQEKKILTDFFSEISQDTGKYCFGIRDINYALEMGAIEILIIDQDLDLNTITAINSDNQEQVFFSKNALQDNLKIIKEEAYIDYIIENHKSFGATLQIVSANITRITIL